MYLLVSPGITTPFAPITLVMVPWAFAIWLQARADRNKAVNMLKEVTSDEETR
jgi:preprotein translocase subunit YajC